MRKRGTLLVVFVVLILNCFATNKNSEIKNSGLNTAANVSYLSPFEKEIVYEINLFRSNPANYAKKYIAPLSGNYKGKFLYYPGDLPLKTREGVRALHECIRELSKAKPVQLLFPNKGLSKAANDHVSDQSRTGKTGHKGRDRSGVKERIERYGKWKSRIAENIAYGGMSARQIVIYLLIDDGVYDRGHRLTFLQPDFTLVGVSTGKHPTYKNMCVMDFAGAFTEF